MPRSMLLGLALGLVPALFTAACAADPAAEAALKPAQQPFTTTEVARFDEPWAMAFLPDGSLLVTEKAGKLVHFDPASGKRGEIAGVPQVAYGGQGGFGDVALHPHFADNALVYYSYAEEGEAGTRGAAVARAKLQLDADGDGKLVDAQVIWRQTPKVSGNGHYGHRLLFGADGKLWVSSSERQKFDPAQDMAGNLGKIIRLNDDGSVPADNPFAAQGAPADQVWSLGHRNILGMAFDAQGRLWADEMGPKGGDELNLIQRGGNYGYPLVSNGDHYDGRDIPDHDTRPEFIAPKVTWTPVISPSSLLVYDGTLFPDWRGSAFIGGLSSQALVRVAIDGDNAREAERFDMGQRIRAVVQGPDGALWLLEDGSKARLLKLTPRP
ncbi:MAG: PQQ-dependent sugar dehydrogenase [Stenotrophomonas sp.]